MRRLVPMLLISILGCATTFATEDVAPANRKTDADPRALFARLVGTWDVRYEFTDKAGNARSARGQVRYSWILDGEAMQETWLSESEGKDLRPFGTTIDFYDPKRQQWTAVWIYPAEGMTMTMTGGEVSGGLLLTGHDESGELQRWSTSVTQSDSVVIRAEASKDEGKTWRPAGVSYLQRHRN